MFCAALITNLTRIFSFRFSFFLLLLLLFLTPFDTSKPRGFVRQIFSFSLFPSSVVGVVVVGGVSFPRASPLPTIAAMDHRHHHRHRQGHQSTSDSEEMAFIASQLLDGKTRYFFRIFFASQKYSTRWSLSLSLSLSLIF